MSFIHYVLNLGAKVHKKNDIRKYACHFSVNYGLFNLFEVDVFGSGVATVGSLIVCASGVV